MRPSTLLLCSFLTGRQYLPFLIVTLLFCKKPLSAAEFTRLSNCSLIFALINSIFLLTFLRPGLASSAISSSEMIQRLISLLYGERGASSSSLSDRLSASSALSLFAPKFFTRRATSRVLLIFISSPIPRVEPTSSLTSESPISVSPENDICPD